MIRDVLTLSRLSAMPADEAAALWIVRLADGEYPHERQLFEEWLELEPGNREAWERAQAGWTLFDEAKDDELLEAMRHHARSARMPSSHDWRRYAAGVALFLVVAGASIFADRSGIIGGNRGAGTAPTGAPPITEASYTYASGRELPKLIVLADGSRMTLDAQSRVTAHFGRNRRSLEVASGRAFFDVHHDAARPFVVGAGNLQAVDIGTRFEVQVAPHVVHVSLVEGRLSVSSARSPGPVLMSPGDQLTAHEGAAPVLTRAVAGGAPGWQQGFATFDNDTLSEAAAVLNRYPGDQILVRNPRVAALRVSGNFKMGDAERFGRTLEQIYPVRAVRRSEHQIELVPAG
jgi:transmembrane sensor